MILQKRYNEIRGEIKPGDVFAFSGKGKFSDLIKWGTSSVVSHVGVVIQNIVDFNQIIEAATINGFSGVSINFVHERLMSYDGGVWWLPLHAKTRERLDISRFQDFLLKQVGKDYDLPQAITAGIDTFDDFGLKNIENFDKLFCSEIVAGAFKVCGIVSLNASETTPIDLCELDIYTENCYQLKGEPAKKFKTDVDFYGFG